MKAVDIIWDVDYEEDLKLLPTEIEIPKGMEDEEEIGDYLSDVTGFCHKGFYLIESEDEIGSEQNEKQTQERTYYHVTLLENVPSISENGLIPQIGERAEEIGEQEAAVFLFPSEEDMNNALMNWLGEWYDDNYGEDCPLAILHVHVPDGIQVYESEVDYEKICKTIIPPACISFFDERGNEIDLSTCRMAVGDRKDRAVPVYSAELYIDQKEIEYMETLMEMTGAQIYDRYGLKRDETITRTLGFQDGSEMDVKVVICEEEEKPYIDIVLFDQQGREMACDTGECSIEGEYTFETRNGIYKGIIQAKERAMDKPGTALDKMIDQAMQQGEMQTPDGSYGSYGEPERAR